MIVSRRKEIVFRFVLFWVRRALRKHFHAIHLEGLEHLQAVPLSQPVIIVANHHTWWDGFFAALLAGETPLRKYHVVQEERHLQRYLFFRYAGVFGIDLSRPAASLPGLRHALQILAQPRNVVWIFPEGLLTSPTAPFQIRGGAELLAKKSGAAILPCYLRVAGRGESRPAALIRLGAPIPAKQIGATLEEMRRATHDFEDPQREWPHPPLLRGRSSINRVWDAVTGQTPSL